MTAEAPDRSYPLAAFRHDVGEDILAHFRHGAAFYSGRPGLLRRLSILLSAPMMCTALFRLSHWAWCRGNRRIAWTLSNVNQIIHGASLHPASCIGVGFYLPHTVGIVFEGHAGRNLVLFASAVVAGGERHPHAWRGVDGVPVLGDDVTLGAFALVSGSLSIGDRVRVAPCAVVHADVPADSRVFGGSPSRVRIPNNLRATRAQRDGDRDALEA